MAKEMQDIIPGGKPERRSIRNIPIPAKRRRTDFIDATQTPERAPESYVEPAQPIREPEPVYQHRRASDEEAVFLHRRASDVDLEPIQNRRATDGVSERRTEPEISTGRRATDIPSSPRRITFLGDRDLLGYFRGSTGGSKKKFIFGSVALIALVLLGLSFFSGGTLVYTPRSADISFNKDTYIAYKDGGQDKLGFSVIKLSGDRGVEAPASGQENVSTKASGKIVVYNNSGAAPQKLIRNTRFESPEGKVYRILSDISVPGKTGTAPGSLEVTVYADQPGDTYNIGLTDFTLPGLKGDPKFTTVYARSKTAMTGGFVGLTKKVSEADLSKARTTLEASLKDQLLNEAKAQVPADFILYPNLVQITYADTPQTAPTDTGVTVNEHADFYGVMFKRAELASYLGAKKATTIPTPLDIPDIASLDASFVGKDGTADLLKAEELSFEVTGSVKAISRISESDLQKDLAGKSKTEVNDVLGKYPGVLSAVASVRPFWKTSFPADPSKIQVTQAALK
ncbi:MAG: hypothetical protein JWN89_158 [Parcubacteria group bacterium]|nr:hypothetical protein [Parcubacteria group bacterium]